MHARRVLLLGLGMLIAGLALLGCSKRERSNPLDPGNPTTGGAPSNFRALAGDGRVTLVWDPTNASGLRGFRLFRRVAGETGFTDVAGRVLDTFTGSYTDLSRTNDVDVTYRIHYVLGSNELSAQYSEGVATPGRIFPYVTEFANGTVARATPDARYISVRFGGFESPNDIAVDPATGTYWTSDTFDNAVEIQELSGLFRRITGLGQPSALALDLTNETAWICEPTADAVSHYTRFGTLATPSRLNAVIDNPLDVAVDPINRTVWVCERNGNRIRAFQPNGQPLWATGVTAPSRVAVDSVTKAGWVTSFESRKVTAFSSAGARLDSVTSLSGPIGVEIDARRGLIWIADAVSGRIVVVNRQAEEQFVVNGLSQVREIDIDLVTGNAWATVPGLNAVAVISPQGQQLRLLTGFRNPTGVVVDPGR